jgi:hypothetical protein
MNRFLNIGFPESGFSSATLPQRRAFAARLLQSQFFKTASSKPLYGKIEP